MHLNLLNTRRAAQGDLEDYRQGVRTMLLNRESSSSQAAKSECHRGIRKALHKSYEVRYAFATGTALAVMRRRRRTHS
jgi:hypothetical protein